MDISPQIEARRRLYGIDDRHWELLRELTASDPQLLARAVARFSNRVRTDSYYKTFAAEHLDEVERNVLAQFEEFCARGMTPAYFEILRRTIAAEYSSSVGARTHVAFGLFVIEEMTQRLGARYPVLGPRLAAQFMRVAHGVFMDVFNIIGLEQMQTRATLEARKSHLERHTADIARAVADMSNLVKDSVARIDAACETTAHAAQTALSASATTNIGIEATSRDFAATAAAAEELSASIDEIDHAGGNSAMAMQDAVSQAQAAHETINGLVETVSHIGSVTDLIASIAQQTNLLALNATIEAARAGEAGRGFAVVAAEVKSLATQTAQATQEIGAQIAAIEAAVKASAGSIADVTAKLADVSRIAMTIGAAVKQQKASTQDIARMMQEAVGRTQQAVAASADVSREIGMTAEATGTLRHLAGTMDSEASRFCDRIETWLDGVKTA
jgi:methyl-accepting chemotaxis protein